jgi:hypothetical protein
MAITGFFIAGLGCFAIMTPMGKKLCVECGYTWKQEVLSLINKRYLIWLLILTGIYLIGIMTIIRANFSYNDDLDRALKGYRGFAVWGRYIADFLSAVLNMNLTLTDISPLPQIFSVIILALATLIFLKILSKDNITIPALLAAVPIGLSPYFMENFSFKFDSPYMALPVLFSIIPFLFYRKTSVYCVTSILCLIAMCMSYQAASGIYIVMVLIIASRLWITNEVTVKNILTFVVSSIACYLFALIFFRTALYVTPQGGHSGYVTTTAFPLVHLLPGIAANSITYVKTIISDFRPNLFMLLLPLSILLFIIVNVTSSARNRILTLVFFLIITPLMFVLSYGAYLALEKALWLPRAFIGFGFFVSAILTYSITMPGIGKAIKACSLVTAFLVSYNFLVIDLAYGNALAEQKQYQNFRSSLLIADINRNLEVGVDEPVIRIVNDIGFSPVIENINKTCPLIKRLVYIALRGGIEWGHLPLDHYRFKHKNNYLGNSNYTEPDNASLPVLVDNGYHTIKGDGHYFFVMLK